MNRALELILKNDVSEIPVMSQSLTEFAEQHGLSPEVLFAVNLSLEEVVTDVISYAYEDEDEHLIVVRLSLEDLELTTIVEDDGRPFNPLEEAPEPDLESSAEDRPIGGLGFLLVKSHMDELEYRREHGKNILVLKKKLTSINGNTRQCNSQAIAED